MSRITQAKLGRAKFHPYFSWKNGWRTPKRRIIGYAPPEPRMKVENPKYPYGFFLASIGQRINISKLRNKIIYTK